MSDFWKRKYNNLIDYLKKEYGASWTLHVMHGVENKTIAEVE